MKDVTYINFEDFYPTIYKVENDELIVLNRNGNIDRIPNTIENQKELLETIKSEVIMINNDFIKKKNKLKQELAFYEILVGLGTIVSAILMLINLSSSILVFSVCYTFLTASVMLSSLITFHNLNDNYKKYNLFLENNTFLNEAIRSNPELINKLSKNIKKKIIPVSKKEFVFTINTIKDVNYRELEKVYNTVSKQYSKNKTLVKKRSKKD